ncbi:hypothetical protein SB758_08950 [Burkholderia sp. SIMBA_013]|nr:hypothetical protein MYA_5232 [Burkholderia sp. KJ006]
MIAFAPNGCLLNGLEGDRPTGRRRDERDTFARRVGHSIVQHIHTPACGPIESGHSGLTTGSDKN